MVRSAVYVPNSTGGRTTPTKTMEPSVARAMRAATDTALSDPLDPSRGTNIRSNIVLLLSTSFRVVIHIQQFFSMQNITRPAHGGITEEGTHYTGASQICSRLMEHYWETRTLLASGSSTRSPAPVSLL